TAHKLGLTEPPSDALDSAAVERRVLGFRRSIVRALVIVPLLFLINAATRGFPWFIFPSAVLLLGLFGRAGAPWAGGVSPLWAVRLGWRVRVRALFGAPPAAPAQPLPPAPTVDPATLLVPADVLGGSYGGTVRRAASDREHIRDIVSKLSSVEKEMLPD